MRSTPPGWVGRDEELRALHERLDRSAAGAPMVVVVVGEPGMGKSSLLRLVLQERAALVLAASGDEGETDLDFGVTAQLLSDVPSSVGRAHRTGADPVEVGATLLRILGEWPRENPVIIAVDDAHLADLPSLATLTFVARRLGADPVAIVLCCRPEGVDRLPPGLLRLAERTGGRFELTGLGADAVGVLAKDRLGRPMPHAMAERLRQHTGGNPLHVLAVVDELGAEAITGQRPLPAPRSYAALVLDRLASASHDAERLLAALAVLGHEARLADAATVGSVEDALTAADEAVVRTGLVTLDDRPRGRVLAYRHSLARTAVYEDLSAPRRAELHRAAAGVTAGEESLRHRIAAAVDPDPELAAETAAQAALLADRGAHNAAAGMLLGAASVAPAPRPRDDHLLAAAHHLLVAGLPLDGLLEAVVSSADSAARSFVLGRVALNAGRFEEAKGWLERASEQADGSPVDEVLASPVAETLAVLAVGDLRQEEALVWAERALATPGSTISATVLCNAYGIDGSFATAERRMDALLATGLSPHATLDALTGRGVVRLWRNDLEGALVDLEGVRLAGVEHGAFHTHVNAGAFLAETHLRLGSLDVAIDTATATATLTDDADAIWLGPLPHSVAAFALAAHGDLGRARAHAARATELAAALHSAPGRLWSDQAWLRIAETAGDLEEVASIGDRMVAAGWERIPEPIHHWRASYVEGLIGVDRLDAAEPVVAGLEREAAKRSDAPTTTDACRARGLLESARERRADAEAAFARGLELDADAARPLERARLELAAGAARRRWGRRRAAATVLEAARARLAAAGARAVLSRAERELAACGLRPVKRSTAPHTAALTPQELTVARLVAAGRTNREAATELVISAKTVEHHLSRIYAKLGIRSRTELAAVLLGGTDPGKAGADTSPLPSPRGRP